MRKRYVAALQRLGLSSLRDVINHFPRRYEDRRHLKDIAALRVGEVTTVHGTIRSLRKQRTRTGKVMVEARVVDPSGTLQVIWFQQPYLMELLRPGMRAYFHGEVKLRRGLQMISPEFEIDEGEGAEILEAAAPPREGRSLHLHRIVPVYPTTRGLHQRYLRWLIHDALASGAADDLDEEPWELLVGKPPTLAEAYRAIHFPPSWEALRRARDRLIFEEYFLFASQLQHRRLEFRASRAVRFRITSELDRKIRGLFPFRMTADQDRAIAEISRDLESDVPMYRLLQGDVGTGKTAVALYTLLTAVRSGHQGAVMVPTEVLAEQHHRNFTHLLRQHPAVKIVLLTGSLAARERGRALEQIAAGKAHLVIGTHALIQAGVAFRSLGVAVIDEQHRFGVRERARLRQKGVQPHLLVMSATPIPRSLCLTAYGDLDLSILRQRPAGRQPVKTILVPPARRSRAMAFIADELRRGRQAYFIYPLIEESENLDLPAALEAHGRLQKTFPEFSVGLLHGRLSSDEKGDCLRRFRARDHQVLVSTVVVEVGIDVANATVLYIEDASRFGLAQLHQLRGRVGRGSEPGYCLIGLRGAGQEARERLEVFAGTEDGFRIAEEDLRLRGPGDFLGVRQSGRPIFNIGNPLRDSERFVEVRRQVESFWRESRFREAAQRFRRRHRSLEPSLESLADLEIEGRGGTLD